MSAGLYLILDSSNRTHSLLGAASRQEEFPSWYIENTRTMSLEFSHKATSTTRANKYPAFSQAKCVQTLGFWLLTVQVEMNGECCSALRTFLLAEVFVSQPQGPHFTQFLNVHETMPGLSCTRLLQPVIAMRHRY